MITKGRLVSRTYAPGRGPRSPVELSPEEKTAAAAKARTTITIQIPPATWAELHARALAHDGSDDSKWLAGFGFRIPGGCSCKNDWTDLVAKNPPDFKNYFAWTVARHNNVNRRLGKPELHFSEAMQIWSLENK